jgi:hypothetical protein
MALIQRERLKMSKLKHLETEVRKILTKYPATRADDDLLYIHILRGMKVDLKNVSAKDFLLSYRKENLPTIETVGRCRRRLQAECSALKPTPEVELKRRKTEQSFYYYSL